MRSTDDSYDHLHHMIDVAERHGIAICGIHASGPHIFTTTPLPAVDARVTDDWYAYPMGGKVHEVRHLAAEIDGVTFRWCEFRSTPVIG